MSGNVAELTLIIQAKNLAETELAKVRTSLSKITLTAKQVATDVANAFKDVGHRIGRQLGNLATDILSGGDITNNLVFMGATMAGAVVEGLSAHLIPQLLAKVAATTFFAPIMASFAAGGVTAGTVFDAAVAIGIAALPFVILAAAVAALVYLITNPEARQKAHDVALMILDRIGVGLLQLPRLIFDVFKNAMGFAGDAIRWGVKIAVDFLLSLPGKAVSLVTSLPDLFHKALVAVFDVTKGIVGKIVDFILRIPGAVADAIASLLKLEKTGPPLLVPRDGGKGPGKAEGGWVGLHGPEMALVGERGPEYVIPNHRLNSGSQAAGGFTIQGVSEKQIMDMVDRGLYFKLQRAAPTILRT